MDATLVSRARELFTAGNLPHPDEVDCVCHAPRAEHSGTSHSGGHPNGCTRYRADPVVVLAARAAHAQDRTFHEDLAEYDRRTRSRRKKKAKGTVSVRPSDIGGCRREIQYREDPPEDFVSAPTRRGAAWMGGIIHDEFMRRRAYLYPWRLYADRSKALAIQLPGSDRDYRYDEYDPITATLISHKTAGRWRWDVVGVEGADEKWWDQDHIYARQMIEQGYPVEWIEVLVIERADGNSERFRRRYDPERAERALDWLLGVATGIELGIEQPRDRSGPTTDMLCRNCFARITCWNMPQAEAAGVTPERFTVLGMDPADEAIEVIGTELVETREARLALEKNEDRLKALLDGVELRPYGDIEPVAGGNTSTAWRDYQAEVEHYWNAPEDERPPLPPEPRKNRSTSVTWKRLRKATRDRLAKERKAAEKAAAAAAAATAELEGSDSTSTALPEAS